MKINATFTTNGRGYWTRHVAEVKCTSMDLIKHGQPGKSIYGELRVYFDPNIWDVNKVGLIYTDTQWMNEFKRFLLTKKLATLGVGYSEQGMQGNDYVSLDVGKEFIDSWNAVKKT